MLGDRQFEGEVPFALGLPRHLVGGPPHRLDPDILGDALAVGGFERDRGGERAGQGALDGERDADRLAGDAEGGRIEAEQLDIGQARRTPDRDGEDGDPLVPEPGRRQDRRLPLVPVAIRRQDDPAEVGDGVGGLAQRVVQVSPAPFAPGREWLEDHLGPGSPAPSRIRA